MSAYRMYFLIRGQIQGGEDFEAADDVAATRIAGVLYDTCSDVCDGFDLWQGKRQLLRATTIPSENQPHRFNRGSSARSDPERGGHQSEPLDDRAEPTAYRGPLPRKISGKLHAKSAASYK